MRKRQFTLALIAILGLTLTVGLNSHAQEPGRNLRRPPPPRQGEGLPVPENVFPGMPGIGRLLQILTPEQKESLRGFMQENREKNQLSNQKLMEARKALMETTLQGKFNERQARKEAKIIAKLESERMVQMAKTFSKVEPPLSREQIRELRGLEPMMGGDMQRPRFRDRAEPPAQRESRRAPRQQDGPPKPPRGDDDRK